MRLDKRERGAARTATSSTSRSASNAAAGSPSAMQITARALSTEPIRSGSAENPESVARASSGMPRRACVAASHPVIRGARACTPVRSDCACAEAANASSADRCSRRPACNIPVVACRSTAAAGSTCGSATSHARRSQRSASSNSPIQIAMPPTAPSAGARIGRSSKPWRSARATARRPRSRAVATETSFDGKP